MTNEELIRTALEIGEILGLRKRFSEYNREKRTEDGDVAIRSQKVPDLVGVLLQANRYPQFSLDRRKTECIRIDIDPTHFVALHGTWRGLFAWVAKNWDWRDTRFFRGRCWPDFQTRAELVDQVVRKYAGATRIVMCPNRLNGGWSHYVEMPVALPVGASELVHIEELGEWCRPKWLQIILGQRYAEELRVPFVVQTGAPSE